MVGKNVMTVISLSENQLEKLINSIIVKFFMKIVVFSITIKGLYNTI